MITCLPKHIKRKHPDKFVKTRFRCPFPDDPHGWAFIKQMVIRSDSNDRSNLNRWTEEDRRELLSRDNNIRQDIAIQMYNRWKSMGEYDDAGGYVKGGLHLRTFSLHKLSPDRINNYRPHFIGNKLDNISLISLGMNTQCNLVSLYGNKTCEFLRERSRKPITEFEIQAVLNREKQRYARYNGKSIANVVYQSCLNAWKKDGHLYFQSLTEMFTYVYGLLVKQQAICLVTGFLMDEHADTKKRKGGKRIFQPSLNAIIPSLGHKPGNLEWVCTFVNASDLDKRNDIENGVPTGWQESIFKSYTGI